MRKPISKIFFFALVIIYVFSTIGIKVVSHYCGGILEKVSLFSKPSSCCSGEDESEQSDCCKNDSKHISFQKDFTFFTIITDCKVPVQHLFIFENTESICFLYNFINLDCFLKNRKDHPPDFVQHDLISSSVLRI